MKAEDVPILEAYTQRLHVDRIVTYYRIWYQLDAHTREPADIIAFDRGGHIMVHHPVEGPRRLCRGRCSCASVRKHWRKE